MDAREIARRLVADHRRYDGAVEARAAWRPEANELRLIEVSPSVADCRDVVRIPFVYPPRPDIGVPCRVALLLLSPGEWRLMLGGELQAPDGWDLKDFDPVEPVE